MAKDYICRKCRWRIPESFASGSREEAINALGTDIAKFIALKDYVWHLKNIHNVTLRVSTEKFDFLEILRITRAHSYSTCTICKPNIFKDPPTMRYSKAKGLEFVERKAKA